MNIKTIRGNLFSIGMLARYLKLCIELDSTIYYKDELFEIWDKFEQGLPKGLAARSTTAPSKVDFGSNVTLI